MDSDKIFLVRWNEFKVTLENVLKGATKHRRGDFLPAALLSDDHAQEVYRELSFMIEGRARACADELVATLEDGLMGRYVSLWSAYSGASDAFDSLFKSLNENYTGQRDYWDRFDFDNNRLRKKLTVRELFDKHWQLALLPVSEKLMKFLDENLKFGEIGDGSVRELIKLITQSIHATKNHSNEIHNLYDTISKTYVDQSATYFRNIASAWIEAYTPEEYVNKCVETVTTDIKLGDFSVPISVETIVQNFGRELVLEHMTFILKEMKIWMDSNEGMWHLSNLFLNFPKARPSVMAEYRTCLREMLGGKVCPSAQEARGFYGTLAEKILKQETIVDEYFNSDRRFLIEVEDELRHIVASVARGETLAYGFHASLITGSLDHDTERCLLTVYKYMDLDNKESFAKSYASLLSARLIERVDGCSLEEEQRVRELLFDSTADISATCLAMIADVEESRRLMAEFKDGSTFASTDPTFDVVAIRQGVWPLESRHDPATTAVPGRLIGDLQNFERLYTSKFDRKIKWLHAFGRCELKLNYLTRSYTVKTTLYLYSILDLFNRADEVSYEEVRASSMPQNEELTRCLKFLVERKILVHRKSPSGMFRLNRSFESESETVEAVLDHAGNSGERVTSKRSALTVELFLEALIARIMKASRRLRHDLLLEEVSKDCRGRVPVTEDLARSVLERLVNKAIVKRDDPPHVNFYVYLP